jgi:dTDP-4-amino-4,6-dideoxygalactose transaminase
MKRIEELLAKREQVAKWYTERLLQVPGVEVPVRLESTTRNTWFVYVIRLQNDSQRESIIRTLKEKGIPARPYFTPIHLQPYMQERFGYRKGDFPHTEDLGNRSLALPFSSIMTEFQVETVCNALKEALSG